MPGVQRLTERGDAESDTVSPGEKEAEKSRRKKRAAISLETLGFSQPAERRQGAAESQADVD